MDRDDQIRYLQDKLAELRRDREAVVDAQCRPETSISINDYVRALRKIDTQSRRFRMELQDLGVTGAE